MITLLSDFFPTSSTVNVLALGAANLIGGLFIICHNVSCSFIHCFYEAASVKLLHVTLEYQRRKIKWFYKYQGFFIVSLCYMKEIISQEDKHAAF